MVLQFQLRTVATTFRRDKDGNVIVTRLNEQMCQEIAKAGNGMYIRVDNTNSAEKVLNNEIAKLSKADVESQVYTEFDEQFQALAWLMLILLVVEMLILERKKSAFSKKLSDYLNKECLCYKKSYITLLFLLVASSAFAQKSRKRLSAQRKQAV